MLVANHSVRSTRAKAHENHSSFPLSIIDYDHTMRIEEGPSPYCHLVLIILLLIFLRYNYFTLISTHLKTILILQAVKMKICLRASAFSKTIVSGVRLQGMLAGTQISSIAACSTPKQNWDKMS